MKEEEARLYEGRAVYFFYKMREKEIPSRVGRGIVFQGACYVASFSLHGKPSVPRIELQAVPVSYVVEMRALEKEQKTSLEQSLEAAFLNGKTSYAAVPLDIVIHKAVIEEKEENKKIKKRSLTQESMDFQAEDYSI